MTDNVPNETPLPDGLFPQRIMFCIELGGRSLNDGIGFEVCIASKGLYFNFVCIYSPVVVQIFIKHHNVRRDLPLLPTIHPRRDSPINSTFCSTIFFLLYNKEGQKLRRRSSLRNMRWTVIYRRMGSEKGERGSAPLLPSSTR